MPIPSQTLGLRAAAKCPETEEASAEQSQRRRLGHRSRPRPDEYIIDDLISFGREAGIGEVEYLLIEDQIQTVGRVNAARGVISQRDDIDRDTEKEREWNTDEHVECRRNKVPGKTGAAKTDGN